MNILVRPIITEKSMSDAENSKFTFVVALTGDKNEIKKEVEKMYSVKVLDIATTIVKGKTKRAGKKRTEKKMGEYKKAIISHEKAQKIIEFDLGEQQGK